MPVAINVNGRVLLKGDGRCPHLSFNGTTASCAVHDKPWFKKSPCFAYGNADIDPDFASKKGRPCAVGALIQSRGLLATRPGYAEPLKVEDLEDVGPWPT